MARQAALTRPQRNRHARGPPIGRERLRAVRRAGRTLRRQRPARRAPRRPASAAPPPRSRSRRRAPPSRSPRASHGWLLNRVRDSRATARRLQRTPGMRRRSPQSRVRTGDGPAATRERPRPWRPRRSPAASTYRARAARRLRRAPWLSQPPPTRGPDEASRRHYTLDGPPRADRLMFQACSEPWSPRSPRSSSAPFRRRDR